MSHLHFIGYILAIIIVAYLIWLYSQKKKEE